VIIQPDGEIHFGHQFQIYRGLAWTYHLRTVFSLSSSTVPSISLRAREHLDQLGDHLQPPRMRAGEDDRLESGDYRLQDDAGVPPGIAVLRHGARAGSSALPPAFRQKPSKKPSGISKKVGSAHAILASRGKCSNGRLGKQHPQTNMDSGPQDPCLRSSSLSMGTRGGRSFWRVSQTIFSLIPKYSCASTFLISRIACHGISGWSAERSSDK